MNLMHIKSEKRSIEFTFSLLIRHTLAVCETCREICLGHTVPFETFRRKRKEEVRLPRLWLHLRLEAVSDLAPPRGPQQGAAPGALPLRGVRSQATLKVSNPAARRFGPFKTQETLLPPLRLQKLRWK